MKLPPYPKYKRSGVEWLGDVPEHWEVNPITRHASEIQTGPFGSQLHEADYVEGGVPLINPAHLLDGAIVPDDRSAVDEATAQRLSRYRLRKDDVIVARRGEIGRCALVTVGEDTWLCGTGCMLLRFSRCDPRYLVRVISGAGFRGVLELRAVGTTMLNLNASILGRMLVPFPPEDEQSAIANFLDREAARIDTLVAKKRTLIERLKEKRTALISRMVTRGLPPDAARAAGLDPHPKLKPSGIDWLGNVPAHWEIKPLGRVAQFRGGGTPDKGNEAYWDGAIPWVSPKDMKVLRISDVTDHVSEEALANSPLVLLPTCSILIVVRGMILAHSFPVAITDAQVTINQDMKALRARSDIDPEFLLWLLIGIGRMFVSLADESAHGTRKLETEIIAKVPLAFPQLVEQRAIADFLKREAAKIEEMTNKVERALDRLQEYRTALITATVTGKIDVRGAAAEAPQ